MSNELTNSELTNSLEENLYIDKPQHINILYPINLNKYIRPNIVIDLNGLLIFSSHLIDIRDLIKYTSFNNFLLLYKDFDYNMFIIYYRNYIKEFLLEVNNYYDIYIYSSINKTQTDLIIVMLINLLGINVFKGVYIKHNNEHKCLENINVDLKYTIIIDFTNNNWKTYESNLIIIPIFKGPNVQDYDKNVDLLNLKLKNLFIIL
jgi:hypothetical protein